MLALALISLTFPCSTHPLNPTHTLTLTLALAVTHIHTHTHTRTRTRTRTRTHTRSRTRSYTHTSLTLPLMLTLTSSFHNRTTHPTTAFRGRSLQQVFGTPLVCRVVPMTGRQLYDKLYRRFHRFLRLKAGGASAASAPPVGATATSTASSSSSTNPPAPPSSSRRRRRRKRDNDRGGDDDPDDDYEQEHDDAGGGVDGQDVQPCMGTGDDADCPRTARATSAWVAAGEVNRWGFRLRLVESNGYACSRCRWTEGCVGCFIRPDDEPCGVRAGDSVGVDWHISVIKVRVWMVIVVCVRGCVSLWIVRGLVPRVLFASGNLRIFWVGGTVP